VTFATLLVHLELGRLNTGLLRVAGDLAERFHAELIGIAACQPMRIDFGDTYVSGEVFEQDREEIKSDIAAAEAEFRGALQALGKRLAWRSATSFEALADYLAREARAADLVVTAVPASDVVLAARRVDVGDLVMQAGRPVFIVPAGAEALRLERVVIAWKDRREARRAVLDAMPLLQMAAQVVVVEIAAEDGLAEARTHIDDVVDWLKRHRVVAESLVPIATGDDALQLNEIVQEGDIIVAGAYGHSRMREWAFGGVTRDILLRGRHCALVSH
jgi:nucleotide-binding universal stress UspA family protein